MKIHKLKPPLRRRRNIFFVIRGALCQCIIGIVSSIFCNTQENIFSLIVNMSKVDKTICLHFSV